MKNVMYKTQYNLKTNASSNPQTYADLDGGKAILPSFIFKTSKICYETKKILFNRNVDRWVPCKVKWYSDQLKYNQNTRWK